ncbi:uncharacterized protein A1O9_10857 [Exophiala aquamarina CBS 119918]|uniref:N-acetyltransferase domain-containing protein n=1 Tax=Exophiala aquamarina CBS 119918 TaxID=1182545 RepID=A0A072NZB3_9EURO|nr:uncharacterized protein A1O9_10857 [Exophiala aquamarina CBS 119918]KEF52951.1 hypothetical protein A1O9_10857 [Exophiala aquamarina CBS 119918]
MAHWGIHPQTLDGLQLPPFDANKYGNPMARKTNSSKRQSPSPGNFGKFSQPRSSTRKDHLAQSWGFEQTPDQASRKLASNSNAGDVTAKATDAQNNKPDSSTVQSTPKSNSKMQIPGFDAEAYGHLGSRGTRTPNATSVISHNSLRDQTSSSQLRKSKVSQADEGGSEVASTVPWGLGLAQSDMEGQLELQTLAKVPITPNVFHSQLQSTNNTRIPDAGSKPQRAQDPQKPVVYETLKKPGESPMETMRRLQVAKQREIMNNIHKSSDKRGQHTANLAELRNLRRPISPEASDSPSTRSQPASNALQVPPTISTPSFKQLSIDSPTPIAGKAPGAVPSVLSNMNPNVSRRPSPLNQYQDSSSDINMKSTINVQSHQPRQSRFQPDQVAPRNNWATSAELKAPGWIVDSNAAGSTASEGSMCHMGIDSDLGRLIRPKNPDAHEASLIGWDGKFVPPPVDWEQRPRFGNDQEHFKADFRNWLGQTVQHTLGVEAVPKLSFERAPSEVVSDINLHPDGLGFVQRHATINAGNAEHYGYDFSADNFPKTGGEPADFDADWRVDSSLIENVKYRDETTNDLIAKKMQLVERDTRRYEAQVEERKASQEGAAAIIASEKPADIPRPKVNLYLRPALDVDIPGMTEILNWYIRNGVRTSELLPISDQDMRSRLNMVKQSKLPFIVAIERTRKKARQKTARQSDNPDAGYHGIVKDEHVIGWVSATDWSAVDYVECISADLELYVAHDYRQKGIGRCLMEALLDATDRGYMKKGKCEFTVAPEMRHMFSSGGMRDLHKIIFQVRSYNSPLPREMQIKHAAYVGRYDNMVNGGGGWDGRGNTTKPKLMRADGKNHETPDDLEDDYAVWLKKWLESFGFEEEGRLRKIGTKNRRFLDLVYLTRETHWQPDEKKLPDYSQHPI